MERIKEGSFEGWNEVWSNEVNFVGINPNYTESEIDTIFKFWQKGYVNDLLSIIKDKDYHAFCELGSGRGTTSMYLSKEGYTDITMVDLADNGFKVASRSFNHYNLALPKFVLANVQNTGLPSSKFDCIYNIGLLEHFEDPSLTLKESFRLLREGGMIFMPIVPKLPFSKSLIIRTIFNPLSIAKKLIKVLIDYKDRNGGSKIYRNDLTRQYYIDCCKEIGFSNIKCIPYNPYWLVNSDGLFFIKIVLPLYKLHYNLIRKFKNIALSTSVLQESCYLLIAEKHI